MKEESSTMLPLFLLTQAGHTKFVVPACHPLETRAPYVTPQVALNTHYRVNPQSSLMSIHSSLGNRASSELWSCICV